MKNYVGESNVNTYGSKMYVVEQFNSIRIKVYFSATNYYVETNYAQFRNGTVKNPFDRSVFGVGYLGVGKYKPVVNHKPTKQYSNWQALLARCYDLKRQSKVDTYVGCTVCEDWHCFQNFAQWFDDNYYEVDMYRMHIDKDILVQNNKIYSPQTCVFVPCFINELFTKRNKLRGDLPIGVTIHNKCVYKKYRAKCCNGYGDSVTIGYYDNIIDAFLAYKEFKENLIGEIAWTYKNKIPDKLYQALIDYRVDISD